MDANRQTLQTDTNLNLIPTNREGANLGSNLKSEFWHPSPPTFYQKPPEAPAIHIEDAGTRAATLITSGPAGTYVIA
jgi:hypothetical protein